MATPRHAVAVHSGDDRLDAEDEPVASTGEVDIPPRDRDVILVEHTG